MEKTSPMPSVYPGGLPLYWGDEQSGILQKAVMAFFDHALDNAKPFAGMQFALVRDYLRYYINAPCWQENGDGDIANLRALVTKLKTPEDVQHWIRECLEIGIDPL